MPAIFMDYPQQIQNLQSKGLVIPDTTAAIDVLRRVGYFQLIGGYKHCFKDPVTNRYRANASFNDILALYQFDRSLRQILLESLLIVEKVIKTQIAHSFCKQYGENQSHYLSLSSYHITPNNRNDVRRLIYRLQTLCTKPTNYAYINYHQIKYHNVPLWILINALTFGSVSKMYGCLPQSLQSKVARNFPLDTQQLESVIVLLTKFRNVCAHGERLFSYVSKNSRIRDVLLHEKMNIQKRNGQFIQGKNDLFAVVIALRYTLKTDEFKSLVRKLDKNFKTIITSCISINERDLLSLMGFPCDWKRITRYRVLQ
ncbi:MAG TPA: Abi family protein [Candidatus Limiplasma sp.]|nr:Abi family protein [Candidatus Limiplasma sp.]HRX07598.1 Abi family protein [Candidatus Limiplasma sp.]